MITGDSQAVADSVARRLGIDEVAAQVLPADKAAAVKRFQEGGRKVAMVGDGVNDAPALATADVGIAIGAGTDVAVESAGIVLVRSDPRDVVAAIELSRATYSKMVQNLVWATGYNLVAIPVAMGIFVPWGIDISMAAGAIAMSLSTIIVAANAQLLRRVRLASRHSAATRPATTGDRLSVALRRSSRTPDRLRAPRAGVAQLAERQLPKLNARSLSGDRPARVLDPVCGMTVDVHAAEDAGLTIEHGGRTYAFCREVVSMCTTIPRCKTPYGVRLRDLPFLRGIQSTGFC